MDDAVIPNDVSKMKAMENLQYLIRSKDQIIQARDEQIQNLQAALDETEQRLAKLICLSVSSTPVDELKQSSPLMNNLSALIRSKERELKESNEKIQTLQTALGKAEQRLSDRFQNPTSIKHNSSQASMHVSKDFYTKLISQNARLKKMLKEILAQKAITVDDYLNHQELLDVITQLRDELRWSEQNSQKIRNTNIMLQAMNDEYSKENERLRSLKNSI